MEFTEITEQEFIRFRNTYKDKNFWQSVEMNHFRADHTPAWSYVYVGLKDNGEVKACCSLQSVKVFGRYRLYMALRGFLIDYKDLSLLDAFIKGLKKYLKKHHCLYMKTDPYFEYQKHEKDGKPIGGKNDDVLKVFTDNGFVHGGFSTSYDSDSEPRWMSVINMEGMDEKKLLAGFDTSTHRNINHTEKMGIQVRELTAGEFDKLEKMVELTGEQRNFAFHDLRYYQDFKKAFGRQMKVLYAWLDVDDYIERYTKEAENAKAKLKELEGLEETRKNISRRKNNEQILEGAEKRLKDIEPIQEKYGKVVPLAAAMFVINEHEVVYLFSGSDSSLKHFKAPYLIQWDMIRYTLEHHIDRYNFYGISGDFSPDSPDYGVYEFKRGFNADVIELIGNFTYIASPSAYRLYNSMRNIKHKLLKQ